MSDPIHIISLGAGVQSSTMALMAAVGELTPMPVAAIFADTQAEPKSVYTWLDWLEKQLPFPVYRVTQGSLQEDTLRIRKRKDGKGSWNRSGIPTFTMSETRKIVCMNCGLPMQNLTDNCPGCGGKDCGKLNITLVPGIGPRQCTHDFKLTPLQRESRRLIKEHGVKHAISWIGISLDEASRMKDSRKRYLTNRFPLIELRMSRHDCIRWLKAKKFPTPPKSACVFCPFHSDHEWRRLRDDEPEAFARAVEFEKLYQNAKRQTTMRGEVYLHSSRVPLDKVDFSTDEDRGQLNLFNNECEGMCGV